MARVVRMGEVYSAGDVVVTVAGMHDVNPSSIEYNSQNAHEYSRGLKREPRGWRMGAEEMTCKITLPLDVIAGFEKIAPGGKLAKLRPFPISVVIFNAENEMIEDYVLAKFQGNGRNISPDSELEYDYDLFVLDMSFNK
ncbi:MAG: hypothetical protein RBS19_03265 [Bacteroidales bacterium]|nr:hypothetical protein [Bacteroidales bacterium]MDY0215957.1 hypothetical protein [Bacteroidales bacterium]